METFTFNCKATGHPWWPKSQFQNKGIGFTFTTISDGQKQKKSKNLKIAVFVSFFVPDCRHCHGGAQMTHLRWSVLMARWFHLGRSVTEVNDREIEQKMQDVVMDAFMSVCLPPFQALISCCTSLVSNLSMSCSTSTFCYIAMINKCLILCSGQLTMLLTAAQSSHCNRQKCRFCAF